MSANGHQEGQDPMKQPSSWKRFAGILLHVLIGGILIFFGSAKLLGLAPPDRVAEMGLTDTVRLIGGGEVVTAILLLIPRTSWIGVLLTSSLWGGAICLHLVRGDSYLVQSVFLVLSWIGTYLRSPLVFGSFWGQTQPETSGPALPV